MRAILCAVLALVVCIGDASAEHEGKTLADMLKQGAETKPFENAETFTLNAAINTDSDGKEDCHINEQEIKNTASYHLSFTSLFEGTKEGDIFIDLSINYELFVMSSEGLCVTFLRLEVASFGANALDHLRHNKQPIINARYTAFSKELIYTVGATNFNRDTKSLISDYIKEFITLYNNQNK